AVREAGERLRQRARGRGELRTGRRVGAVCRGLDFRRQLAPVLHAQRRRGVGAGLKRGAAPGTARKEVMAAIPMEADRTKLLFAPYQPPALKVGDRGFCLYRNAEVVVYDWSLAPVPWPLCYQASKPGSGKGILVDFELARAIRHESAAAVQYWWG